MTKMKATNKHSTLGIDLFLPDLRALNLRYKVEGTTLVRRTFEGDPKSDPQTIKSVVVRGFKHSPEKIADALLAYHRFKKRFSNADQYNPNRPDPRYLIALGYAIIPDKTGYNTWVLTRWSCKTGSSRRTVYLRSPEIRIGQQRYKITDLARLLLEYREHPERWDAGGVYFPYWERIYRS